MPIETPALHIQDEALRDSLIELVSNQEEVVKRHRRQRCLVSIPSEEFEPDKRVWMSLDDTAA